MSKLFTALLSVVASSVAFAASEGKLENLKPSAPNVCVLSVGIRHGLSGSDKEMKLNDGGKAFFYQGVLVKLSKGGGVVACGERAYLSETRKLGPIEKTSN